MQRCLLFWSVLLNLINVVRDVRHILESFHNFKVVHAFREGNKCADWLASWARPTKNSFLGRGH